MRTVQRICIILLVCMGYFPVQAQQQQVDPELNRQLQKLNHFIYLLSQQYVDTMPVARHVEDGIRGVLKELDPHSTYMSKAENLAAQEQFKGNLVGVGVEIMMLNDTLLVTRVISGGPADKAGVLPDDMILSIDDTRVSGVKYLVSEAKKKIVGEKGSNVSFTFKRGSDTKEVKINRDDVARPCLEAAYLIKDGVGYIRLARFMATTTSEFEQAMARLSEKGPLHSLVLDLRDNGGGYMTEALKMCDHFLGDKCLLLSTRSRTDQRDYMSTKSGIFENGRLVVLVNQNSASASEIVSGAMQDWDRGIIVGRRTFGKGLVQTQFPLADSSSVNITTARYYTPSGRSIQKTFRLGEGDKYREDAIERLKHGELFSKDSIVFDTAQRCKTLKNGRIVYGGGGITPDVFVPLDTLGTGYTVALHNAGILQEIVVGYVRDNRSSLTRKYASFDDYKRLFVVPEMLMKQLDDKAKGQKVRKSKENIAHLKQYIKGMIAQRIYTSSEYYRVINEADADFLQAVRVIDHWDEQFGKILK